MRAEQSLLTTWHPVLPSHLPKRPSDAVAASLGHFHGRGGCIDLEGHPAEDACWRGGRHLVYRVCCAAKRSLKNAGAEEAAAARPNPISARLARAWRSRRLHRRGEREACHRTLLISPPNPSCAMTASRMDRPREKSKTCLDVTCSCLDLDLHRMLQHPRSKARQERVRIIKSLITMGTFHAVASPSRHATTNSSITTTIICSRGAATL